MNKVILQPAGNKGAREHYKDTVNKNVPLSLIKKYVTKEEFDILKQIYQNDNCKIWGVTPGKKDINIPKWKKIDVGDVTLFSKEGHIFASGVATLKLRSKLLAEKLWGYDDKNQTWEYIYFLDEIKEHKIPYIEFNKVVGYKDNYIIQGFNVLNEERSFSVLGHFNLQSNIYIKEITPFEYEKIEEKLNSLDQTNVEYLTNKRLEQGYLKQLLFGKKTKEECSCCRNVYPISFLVTAHIKKRSKCSKEERLDKNVVMSMCKFGCDDLFEKGYITVSNGIFIDLEKSPINNTVNNYIKNVIGNECKNYNKDSMKYFEWHQNYHDN